MNAAKNVPGQGAIRSPLLDNRDIFFDNTFPIAINENSFTNILNLLPQMPSLFRSSSGLLNPYDITRQKIRLSSNYMTGMWFSVSNFTSKHPVNTPCTNDSSKGIIPL